MNSGSLVSPVGSFPNDCRLSAELREVIQIDADEQVDLPNPAIDADVMMRDASPVQGLPQARGTSSRARSALGTPPPTPRVTSIIGLQCVPENQVGASKKALIQLKLMNDKLKEVRDAGEALEETVRVSTLVSTFFRHNICVGDVFRIL